MSTDIYPSKNDYSEKLLKLMIKKHMKVGIKYLCKTIQEDHNKYLGSGTEWGKILKEHGRKHVRTKVIFTTHSKSEFKKVARMFSDKWDIVESKEWANKIKETGDGAEGPASEETKAVLSAAQLKRYKNPKERKKSSDAQLKSYEENPERAKNHSDAMLKHYEENPERAKNHSEIMTKLYEDPKARKVLSDAQLKSFEENLERAKNHSDRMTKLYEDLKNRELQSAAQLKSYKENPERAKNISDIMLKHHEEHPETRKVMSDAMKKHYEDPKNRKRLRRNAIKHYEDPKEREKTGRNSATVWSNKRAAKSVEFVDTLRSALKR